MTRWTKEADYRTTLTRWQFADRTGVETFISDVRAPSLSSGRDLRKIAAKLSAFSAGLRQINPNFHICTPLVIPLPHSPLATALNRDILRLTLAGIRRQLGMRQFQLCTFLPSVADYLNIGESISIYYCTDNWAGFSCIDAARISAAEQRLARRVNLVFATAQSLVDRLSEYNPNTRLAPHGVDHALFASALDPATPIPPDIAALPRPILGFYGTIHDWVDLDLVGHLARRHPEWSIAMIGWCAADVSRLRDCPNVHFLGRKPHDLLPAYCRAFDVGLIPQKQNALTRNMNPIKLREYLSAGLPVVATAMPEVAAYAPDAQTTTTYDQFEQAVARALQTDSPAARQRRSQRLKPETWQRRVADLCAQVMRTANTRPRDHRGTASPAGLPPLLAPVGSMQ